MKTGAFKYFFLVLSFIIGVQSFAPPVPSPSSWSCLQLSKDSQEDSLQEKVDQMLDRQFFDPEKILENESPEIIENPKKSKNPAVWLANLALNDYETAEALFAAGFIGIMIVIAKELLRMVLYGDAYQPFQSGGGGGGSMF